MANKTLIIKMDPSATFTGGSTASSGIATYNNKIITGVGTGNTNLTLNFVSSKVASRTFNKVFNIKVSKSKLQILQDEYNAACAAIEEVKNWFKNNNVYLVSHFNNASGRPDTVVSILLNITYNSPPYPNRTILLSSNYIYYTSGGEYDGNSFYDRFAIGHYSNLIGTVYSGYDYNISNHYDFLIQRIINSDPELYISIVGDGGTNLSGVRYYRYYTLTVNGTDYSRTSTLITNMVNKLKNIRDVYTIYQEILALGGTP